MGKEDNGRPLARQVFDDSRKRLLHERTQSQSRFVEKKQFWFVLHGNDQTEFLVRVETEFPKA